MALRYVAVDDAAFIRELLKSVMSSEGHLCVGEAGDGVEAVSVTAKTLPDLVFLDLVMPRKTGLQAAKEILEIWPEARLIACTTLEEEQIGDENRRNFHAFLVKPFSKESLSAAVAEAMGAGEEAGK